MRYMSLLQIEGASNQLGNIQSTLSDAHIIHMATYTGCPKINFTFLKFRSFESKPPIATPES